MSEENFIYKRSLEMEDNTVGTIVEWLFNSEIASKSDKEIMAYVMELLGAACLTELKSDGEKVSSEHFVLLHFNQFCNSICEQLKSNKPLSFTLQRVVSVDSLFSNLESIKKIAASEPYADDITKRLDMFIMKIRKKIIEIGEFYRKTRIEALLVGVFFAVFLAFVTWPDEYLIEEWNIGDWMSWAVLYILFAAGGGIMYYKIKTR